MKLYMWLETEQEKELKIANGYNVTLPVTMTRTLDESLDCGHFQIRNNSKEVIVPFTKCKIIDDNNITTYWFAHSTARSLNLSTNRWLHDVYLIEPTKILERHILGARAFSSGSSYFKTNKQLINLILETCYPTREGEINPLYDSSSSDYIFFDDKGREEFNRDAKEYFFPEGTTLFEALETIGKSINAFPRMIDFHTLTFDFYNGTKEADISMLNLFDETVGYNLDQYCGSIHSVVSNAIDLNKYEISPCKNKGMTLRSETVRITDDTAILKVDKPIYKINKMLIKTANKTLYVYNGIGDSNKVVYNLKKDIDITNYIFEEKEFILQENDPSKAEGMYCSLCYKMGNNTIINFGNYTKNFLGIPGFYAIQNIIEKEIQSNPDYYRQEDTFEEILDLRENIAILPIYVEYIPVETLSVKLFNNKRINNSLIFNPSSNIIDINYYGENLKSTIDKLGNEERALSFHTKTHILPNPGEKIGDYYISKVDSEYYKQYSKIKIELVKNFNKICEDVGIDSQLRLYAIPDDAYVTERIIHLDSFCFINNNTKENLISDLTSDSLGSIIKTINFSDTNNILNISKVKKDDFCLLKPISKYRIANSILMSFGFDNNFVGGYYKDGNYNKAIGYANEKGERNSFEFKIVSDIDSRLDSNLYPKYSYYEDSTEVGGGIKAMETIITNLKKDARETIKVCYQIHFISENKNIILGDAFYKYNGLITDLNKYADTSKINLYVNFFNHYLYNGNAIINFNDDSHQLDDTGKWINFTMDQSSNWINFKCGGVLASSYKSFALTNEKGEILLIVNDIKEENPIYFNLSNSYN